MSLGSKAGDPWRLRCPKGHSSITSRSEGHYCGSCGRYYATDPVDAAAVDEWPATDQIERLSPWTILVALVEQFETYDRDGFFARELAAEVGSWAKAITPQLKTLRDFGVVTAIETGYDAYRYEPTTDGREWVLGAMAGEAWDPALLEHSDATDAALSEDTA